MGSNIPTNILSHNQSVLNQQMEQSIPIQSLQHTYQTIQPPAIAQSLPQFGSYLVQPKFDINRSLSPSNNNSIVNVQQNLVTVIGHSPFSPFTVIKQPNASFISTQSIKPTPFQGQNVNVSDFHQNGMPTLATLSPAQQSKISQSYAVKSVNQLLPVFVQPQFPAQSMPSLQSIPSSNSPSCLQPQRVRSPSHEAPLIKHETCKSSSSHKDKDPSDSINRESASITDIALALTTAMHEDRDGTAKPRSDWNMLEKSADGPLSELLKAFMERHEQPANIDQNQSMMDVHSVKTLLAYVFNALSDHDSDVMGCIHCHEKKGSRWTDADDRAMIDLLSTGHDFNEIAKKLKRTIRALKDRYCYLKKSQALDIKSSTVAHRDIDQSRRQAVAVSPSLPASDLSARRRKSSKRKRKFVSGDSSQSESEDSSTQRRRITGLDTLASTASTSSSDGTPQSPSAHSDNGSQMSDQTDGSTHGSWTAEEEEQVLLLLRNGASLRECAALSGRSVAAIKGKMQRNKSRARGVEAHKVSNDLPVPAVTLAPSLPTAQAS